MVAGRNKEVVNAQRRARTARKRVQARHEDPHYRFSVGASPTPPNIIGPAHVLAHTKFGIPHGVPREKAERMWLRATRKARRIIKRMKDEGIIPAVVVPDSDEAKAEAALVEACKLALGPTENKIKVAAINTVLNFTKQKPTQKIEQSLTSEGWLEAALKDNKNAGAGQS